MPSIEQLTKGFADEGWAGLAAASDRTDTEQTRRESRQRAVGEDVLWLARQPQGRRVLEFIMDNSIRRASWHGDLRFTIEQTAAYGLLREGQNSIAAMLIAALRHATGGDVTLLTKGEVHDHSSSRYPRNPYTRLRAACRGFAAGWRRG